MRIEDDKGAVRDMDYFAPNWVVGPDFSPPTVAGMEQVLRGSNEVKLLEALVWLSGDHTEASRNPEGYGHEEERDGSTTRIRHSPRIVERSMTCWEAGMRMFDNSQRALP